MFIAAASSNWPFAVLLISVAFVVLAISWWKLHAFLSLILAALLAGSLASSLPADAKNPGKGKFLRAVELTTEEFGSTAGKIAIVIGMATIIGMSMMASGAADKVVRRFLAITGEKRAGIALMAATYVLSIPIFFDTMFMLMAPIGMAMALRLDKKASEEGNQGLFVIFTLAVCAGGVVTHSMTVPHPGPLAMVESFNANGIPLDLGISLLAGVVVGIIPVALSWWFIKRQAAANRIPLRETPSAPLSELRKIIDRPESELPSFFASILPVILPIALISMASFFEITRASHKQGLAWASFAGPAGGEHDWFRQTYYAAEFIGNKNVALMAGALLSLLLLVRQRKLTLSQTSDMLGPPLETAGVIILITAAGGAFGLMLKNSGVGDAIRGLVGDSSLSAPVFLLLAWLVSVVIRVAQGSATVAMITTSAMLAPLMLSVPVHPVYPFLAIGFGAICCSWMNDSGFWVVSRLSGFTARETLRTWTLLLTFLSVTGLLATLLISALLPLR